MNKKKQTGLIRYTCFSIIILYSIMPIVGRLISTYTSTYTYMCVLLVAVALTLLSKRLYSLNEYLTLVLPFIVWKLLTLINRTDSIIMWGYGVLLEFVPIFIGYYVVSSGKKHKKLAIIIIFAFIITGITTLIGLMTSSEAARWIATVASSQNANLIEYDMRNIGGYSFIYSAVLLYPLVVYAYKQKMIPLAVAGILSVLIGTLTFFSSYTIAFLLFLITSCLYLVKRDLRIKDIFILIAVAIIIYSLFTTVFSDFFLKIADLTNDGNMRERFTSLAGGYEGLKGSESKRLDLYWTSISTFINNPLFGNTFTHHGSLGGHSFILDFLGQYGFVGAVFLVLMYKKIFRVFYLPLKDSNGYGFIVWSFMQAILLSFINTGMWIGVLCMFIPIIIYSMGITETEE